jgi:3-oxoacyl-[acyl-carrier-protein] synthase II
MNKKIVVTGMGAITPLGHSVEETWAAIKAGKSGVGINDRFDTTEFATKIAGLVKNFNASDFMDKKEARKMALFTQYAVAAAKEAMEQAGFGSGFHTGDIDSERTATVIGNGIGGFEIIEEGLRKLFESGPSRIPPMTIPKMITNEAPGNIAITYNIHGPAYTIATACASATDAIGSAKMLIETGQADVVIAGGTEAAVTPFGIAGFNVIQALSTGFNDAPEKASRPFDKDRDGFIMAEGAGILILESEEHAKARGARIIAEIAGFGMTCDAHHLTAPHPEGVGAARAMKIALQTAGLKPEDVDYINAHGTSTPTNDPLETKSIKKAFGDHAYKLKVSSTKSMTGHMVGAAGAVEAIISIKAIQDNFVPPTTNLDNPDPECDLDYVPNKGIEMPVNVVLSNSLGFGGHNSAVILKRYQP